MIKELYYKNFEKWINKIKINKIFKKKGIKKNAKILK